MYFEIITQYNPCTGKWEIRNDDGWCIYQAHDLTWNKLNYFDTEQDAKDFIKHHENEII